MERQKDLRDVGPKQRKVVHYKTIFYRNAYIVSEFNVLFSFSFILFQISGAMFPLSDKIFSQVFFLSPDSNFWCEALTGWYNFLFASSSYIFFFQGFLTVLMLLLCELNFLHCLSKQFWGWCSEEFNVFVEFLLLSFLLEKMYPETYLLRVEWTLQIFCFLQKETKSVLLFYRRNKIALS